MVEAYKGMHTLSESSMSTQLLRIASAPSFFEHSKWFVIVERHHCLITDGATLFISNPDICEDAPSIYQIRSSPFPTIPTPTMQIKDVVAYHFIVLLSHILFLPSYNSCLLTPTYSKVLRSTYDSPYAGIFSSWSLYPWPCIPASVATFTNTNHWLRYWFSSETRKRYRSKWRILYSMWKRRFAQRLKEHGKIEAL